MNPTSSSRFPALFSGIYDFFHSFRSSECACFSGTCLGKPMKALLAGPSIPKSYYPRMLFGSNTPAAARKIRNRDLQEIISSSAADVFILNGVDAKPGFEHISLPYLVRCTLPVTGSFQAYLASLGKSSRNELKKIRTKDFEVRISRDLSDFREFYHRSYVPSVLSRFGQDAFVEPEEKMKNFFRRGFLLNIKRDGKTAGSMLLVDRGETLLAKIWGVAGGSDELMRKGIKSALLYNTIRLAFSSDYSLLDLGRSMPFLSDTALQYKIKWKARLAEDPYVESAIYVHFRNSQTKEIFCRRMKPITVQQLQAGMEVA